jgi:hypothetical protein
MATVTTELSPEISATLDRLEALYYELDFDKTNSVFDKIIAEFRHSKLPEPYLSAEIEKVKIAMDFPPGEVERIIRSGRAGKKQSGDIEATLLYDKASSQLELYQDTTNTIYARFEADREGSPHYELHPLTSTPIRAYLRKLARKELDKVVRRDVINSVLEQLQADEATPAILSHRIAQLNGAFYYNIADQDWSAIEITPEGWEYCYYEYDLPPLFIANSLQAEQAKPDSLAAIQDIKGLFDFCNIPGPDQQLLTVVWLISTFIPTLKIPILYVYGEKGSGKTFVTKALAQLADPTVTDPTAQDVDVLGQPPNREAATTQLSHRHFVAYDNVYFIQGWFANLLSTRTTGSIEEKKKLYTDSEPYIMRLAGPIILNGIHRRGLEYTDLQDRIIAIHLDRREDNKSEAEYWKQFKEIRSTVLGAIFYIISRAMAIEPTLQIKPISRFVDFERWGCAIAQAMNEAGLSYSQSDFRSAYSDNIKNVRYSVLEGHPVAQCIIHLRNSAVKNGWVETPEWVGTPDKLLKTLNTVAAGINVDTTLKTWPKSARWLTQRLEEIRSELKEIGITYSERKERPGKGVAPKRIIRLAFLPR